MTSNTIKRDYPRNPDGSPDFETLRRNRDEALNAIFDKIAADWGTTRDKLSIHISPNTTCYCDCGNGGPCEHEFTEWRDFTPEVDGCGGGEAVCKKCGMGAMSHTLHTCD